MKIRFRIGPFTFGSSGIRLSTWRRGSGFSVPITNRSAPSFGKIKLGLFSFYFNSKSNKRLAQKNKPNYQSIRKETYKQAYEPWSKEADKKLTLLFRQGQTVKELSETFGRSKGAIHSRMRKLKLE